MQRPPAVALSWPYGHIGLHSSTGTQLGPDLGRGGRGGQTPIPPNTRVHPKVGKSMCTNNCVISPYSHTKSACPGKKILHQSLTKSTINMTLFTTMHIGVGSRGARGAVAPLDFLLRKQVWSEIKVQVRVLVWVTVVGPPSPNHLPMPMMQLLPHTCTIDDML